MSKPKLIHSKSGVLNKKPTPEQLELGQISLNYNATNPFLAFKDSENEIVTVPTEKAIAPMVEEAVEEQLPGIIGQDYYNKEQVDSKLAGKADVDDLEGLASQDWVQQQNYATSNDLAGLATKQEVNTGLAGKANVSHTHTVNQITDMPDVSDMETRTHASQTYATKQEVPSKTSQLTNDSGFITNSALSEYYTKDQSDAKFALKTDVPEDVYSKEETNALVESATTDMATETWVGEQGFLTDQDISGLATKQELSSHTEDTTVHITAAERLTWNNKSNFSGDYADLSNKPDLSSYFDEAQYDSQTKRINFYHGETVVAYVDATAFIKDGMVSNVAIVGGNLVITFNADAGKESISIPLTDIFDPSNYYNKSQVDTALAGKSNTGHTHVLSDITDYVAPDLTPYATNASLNEHSGNTVMHTTAAEKATWNAKSDFSGDYEDLTNKPTIPVVPTNVSAFNNDAGYLTEHQSLDNYYQKSETSGATQIQTALDLKADASSTYSKSEVDTAIATATNDMATETWVGQQGFLTQHQSLDNYYQKSETSGATQIQNALDLKQDALVSGTNIKTINNQSLLGEGNIEIEGGGGKEIVAGTNISITSGETQDTINCTLPIHMYTQSVTFNGQSIQNAYGVNFFGQSNTFNNNVSRVFNFGDYNSYPAYGSRFYVSFGEHNSLNAFNGYNYAFGNYLQLNSANEVAFGKYNVSDNSSLTIGNGTSTSARSNLFEVKNNGDVYVMLDGQFVKLQDQLGGGGGTVTVDDEISSTSENPVQNKVIKAALDDKFDASGITAYTTSQEVSTAIATATNDMATQSWVNNQGFLTQHQSLAEYYTKSETSGATQIQSALDLKADASSTYSKSETSGATQIQNALDLKQDTLVAGTNITIEGNVISATGGGGGGGSYTAGSGIYITNDVISIDEGMLEATSHSLYELKEGLFNTEKNLAVNYYTRSQSDAKYTTNASVNNKLKSYYDKDYIDDKLEAIAAGLVDLKETNSTFELKAWRGTQAQYDALTTKDADRLYIIID